MAATYVDVGGGEDEIKEQPQLLSPRNLSRTWSSNSSAGSPTAGSPPVCVCAPATHPGSFKCRLHRVNSNGHSSSTQLPQQQRPVSNSSTRTVEAL